MTTSFTVTDALFTELAEEEWSEQSLCPDWNVREVLVHRIGIEHVLTGWAPSTEDPPPFELLGELEAELAPMAHADVLARAREIWAARTTDLGGVDQATVDTPSFTPTGIGTYGDFMRMRIFDSWVHERDVTIPLGRPTDDSGARAAYSLDEVESAMGYIVGKRIGMPDGSGITFHITGGVERDIHVAVEGRAAPVDSLEDPTCEVWADVATFVMLAAGRIDPDGAIESGSIRWTGDGEWGEKAARSLAYTR